MTKFEAGVRIERTAEFKISKSDIASGLVETVGNFVLKGWADGGVSGLLSLTKVITSANIEESVEARAWRIVILSFAWSIGHIVDQGAVDKVVAANTLQDVMQNIKNEVENSDYRIDADFLKYPASLNLYNLVKNRFIDELVKRGALRDYEREPTSYKINIAFNRAVFEVWSRRTDYFQPISDIIASPGYDAVRQDAAWLSNSYALKHAFSVAPVFGQSDISLEQLYVPLRAFWQEAKEPDGVKMEPELLDSEIHFTYLEEAIDEWMSNKDDTDWLRLIGGGPGSGKSTSLKAIASKYADRLDWRTLYVPLQHIGISGDLRESVNSYFTWLGGGAFNQPPLSRDSAESGPPFLLIFDGLDELIAPNQAASDVIVGFASKLNSLMLSLQGDSLRQHKVIVSGRLPSFQLATKLIHAPAHGRLEVFGFTPYSDYPEHALNAIETIDQRPEWWKKYSTSKQIDDKVPAAFESSQLEGITHEHLLF